MAKKTKRSVKHSVQRVGDKVIHTEVVETPGTVDYSDILDHVEIVPDEEARVPWEDCDGYDHDAVPASSLDEADVEEMQGYAWDQDNRQRVVIKLTNPESWGIYKYLRERGASKQVAREMEALAKRRTLEVLVNWYENGWQYWGVTGDYLDGQYTASVWGVDDDDYAEREVKHDIASEMVAEMVKDGYTVENQPDRQKGYLANRIYHIRRNLLEQSWIPQKK